MYSPTVDDAMSQVQSLYEALEKRTVANEFWIITHEDLNPQLTKGEYNGSSNLESSVL